jgi:aminoglycoside phosphotransferase (APT) family kinase protein
MVPEVDPRDPQAVAAAVRAWTEARFAGPVALVGEARSVGAGFDSYIHLLQLAGDALPPAWRAPLVVRIVPTVDRSQRATTEAAVQSWCAEAGYPCPRVLAVLPAGEALGLPAQVMERAPGVTMVDALTARPWRAPALVDQLASLQLCLHALDPDGWPASTAPQALVDLRLALPRRAAAQLDDPVLARALEAAEAMAATCTTGDVVICHGDFHPLNVMVDGKSASVLDWTDAGLGPREADVARTALLFNVAALAAGGRLERVALRAAGPRLGRRYLRAYASGAPLDADRMRRWDALHALHGWAQILLLHAGAFDDESSSAGAEQRAPIALAHWLRARFESDLT